MCESTYPKFETARILRYPEPATPTARNSRPRFSTASSVIALPGTLLRFSLPSQRIVMPSCEMPYRARDPSMVAVFIDSVMPAQSSSTMIEEPPPRISSKTSL